MNYPEFKGLKKQAILITDAAGAVSDFGSSALVLLIAGLGSVGAGAGWGAAKLNAHDKQDIDTIQKEYENERLKADLGYVSAKTKQEYDAFKRKQPPKAARVIA